MRLYLGKICLWINAFNAISYDKVELVFICTEAEVWFGGRGMPGEFFAMFLTELSLDGFESHLERAWFAGVPIKQVSCTI